MVLKKLKVLLVGTITLTASLFNCAKVNHVDLTPTNNAGGYVMSSSPSSKTDELLILGVVKDVENISLVPGAQLTISCYKIYTDENGAFQLIIDTSNELSEYVTARVMGYKTIETDFINMSPGDSINVDFYLATDDRPIIHCDN